jgi:hypothetical protein
MQLSYTYWNAEEGGYLGFLDKYPAWWTQGETIPGLEEMLVSSYEDFNDLMTDKNTKSNFLPHILYHGTVEIAKKAPVPA